MGRGREENKILVVGLPPGSTSTDLTKLVKYLKVTSDAALKEQLQLIEDNMRST